MVAFPGHDRPPRGAVSGCTPPTRVRGWRNLCACDRAARGAPVASGPSAGQGGLALQADTVFGGSNVPQGDVSCTLNNRFPRTSQVVWRAAVTNPATGQALDDAQITSVIVTLDDGQQFPMRYSGHPPTNPTTSFWATSWTVPNTYPTGIVHYSITATAADGRTTKWQPLNVDSSELTVTESNPNPAGA